MPQSRHRHKHGHSHAKHPPAQPLPKAAPRRSAITIMVIFLGLLGIAVAAMTAGGNFLWLAAGALAGGIMGYFIGQSMDKVAAKNK